MQRTYVRLFPVLFVLYSAFCLLPSAFAQSASVHTVVQKLQARYDSTAGFRADFRQEVESATLGQKVTAHGQVYFRKPGRMRWEFVEPEQLMVSDGKIFWLYQPSEKQVLKTPFQSAFQSNTPVSFLLGIGRIDQDFTVSLTSKTPETYSLRLLAKKDPETIGALDLEVMTKTFDIIQATITDPLGNTTRLWFSHIDRKAPLKDELFHFTIPPGVDVVDAGGGA
ncbi:MAG: outer membrane lipoprotein carrier protein LolA [Deltaproteobacteria bacterium]|nr:outer membrane lipoprotein carrier protein LolA [Deltaproteobacteria bacterium]